TPFYIRIVNKIVKLLPTASAPVAVYFSVVLVAELFDTSRQRLVVRIVDHGIPVRRNTERVRLEDYSSHGPFRSLGLLAPERQQRRKPFRPRGQPVVSAVRRKLLPIDSA